VFGRVDGYREEDRHEYEITQLNLRALAREDIREYFLKAAPERPVLTDDQVYRVDAATSAIPLAVKLAADIWHETGQVEDIITSDDLTEEDIIDHMVGRYQQHCVYRSEDRRTLWAIAMAGGDPGILKAMLLPDFQSNETYREHLAYVCNRYEAVQRKNTREPRLHDEPSRFFLDHLRSEAARTDEWVQRFNNRAVQWLCGRIEQFADYHPTLQDLCGDADYVESVIKVANHLFWIDEDEAWPWFTSRYVEGVAYSTSLREGLVEIAVSWHSRLSARGRTRTHILQGAERYPLKPAEQDARRKLLDQDVGRGFLNDSRIQSRFNEEREAIVLWAAIESLRVAGKYTEALTCALSVASQLEVSSRALREKVASSVLSLSYMMLDEKESKKEIRQALEFATRLDPENYNTWLEFGAWLLSIESYDEAEALLAKAKDLSPQEAVIYQLLSYCQSDQKRHAEALENAKQAVELQPKREDFWRTLGGAYQELGQYEEAIRCQSEAVQLAPNSSEAWRWLGNAYSWHNEPKEAIRCYGKALEFDVTIATLRSMGWCFLYLNQFDSAEEHFLRALEFKQDDAEAHRGLGCLWMMRGQNEKAVAEFKQVLLRDETDARAHNLWGRMLYHKGDYEGAWNRFERAVRIQPNNLTARAALLGLTMVVERKIPEDLIVSIDGLPAEARDPLTRAEWLALNGETEEAVEVIAESVKQSPNNATYVNYCPALHYLRDHPGLKAILTSPPDSGS
jgi:tetratricopeptide (TPR) repeat protein